MVKGLTKLLNCIVSMKAIEIEVGAVQCTENTGFFAEIGKFGKNT